MMIERITKRNNNAPPIDNPNIKGQSTSSSLPLSAAAGTVNCTFGSKDEIGPEIAFCTLLAEIGDPVPGFVTTKLTVPVASILTRI